MLAARLVPVDRDRRVLLVLLITLIVFFAAGIFIAAAATLLFGFSLPIAAAVVAILLGVD